MTAIKTYRCDLCRKVYDTAEKAEACEGSHVFHDHIESDEFVQRHKYPQSIIVVMGDGARLTYFNSGGARQ